MAFFNNFNTIINMNYCGFNGLNNCFANMFSPFLSCGFGFNQFFDLFPTQTSSFPPIFMPDFSNIFSKPNWESYNSSNIWEASNLKFDSPKFDASNTTWNTNWNTDFTNWGDKFVKSSPKTTFSTKPAKLDFKTDTLKLDGYNETAGKKLASIAWNNAHHGIDKANRKISGSSKNPQTFTGNCARYVKIAIRDAGLGAYPDGHAYQMIEPLRQNKNFKEISTEGVNLKQLPAGCVLVYGKGVSDYSNKYGHIELTLGNGKAVSDGTTDNLYKKPSAIFMPV